MPELAAAGLRATSTSPFLGASLDGRLLTYYLLFVAALVLVLALLRIVNSPFGRVLQAIRENDFRAEAIGYRTVVYRTLAQRRCRPCSPRWPACMLALWLRYNGPDTTLSFEIMLDVLLIVVIGGMGTIYGAVVGSVLFVLAQSYLQDLLKLGAATPSQGVPVLSQLRLARPLAALAGHPVRALGLLLPERRRRPLAPARRAQGRRVAGAATSADVSPPALAVAVGDDRRRGRCARSSSPPARRSPPATTPRPWPTAGWEVSTPEAQGVSSSALADLVDFGAANDMDSLLVVRHGRIVAEAYYAPFRPGMRTSSTR